MAERNIRIYYSDLDRLTLECVWPVLEPHHARLRHCFCERHYAGGAHLRVSLSGDREALDDVAARLVRQAGAYLRTHPSAAKPYAPDRARKMLEREGEPFDSEDLTYRHNCVVDTGSSSRHYAYRSDAAAAVADDFRHDAMPLAIAISKRDDRRDQMFRVYVLYALLAGKGDMAVGSVSLRSHWEGFADTYPELIDAVDRCEAASATRRLDALRDVDHQFHAGTLDQSPILSAWHALYTTYSTRAAAILERGDSLTYQPVDPADVNRLRDKAPAHRRSSTFMEVLFADPRFLASVQYEPTFLRTRVMTNLLYILVALAGFHALDRQLFCCLTWRTVERHCGCDLTERLRANVAAVVKRHAARWEGTSPPRL